MEADIMGKVKFKKLEEMEFIAKKATHDALLPYPRLEGDDLKNLTLGTRVTDSEGIFELYIAGERPLDAKVISCARVDRRTGAVSVEVFLEKLRNL
jgi:hypothetical protein